MKKISQNFFAALFIAAICMVFSAGCASGGGGVETSITKTNTATSTERIYSVTLENGEKQQMTEAEFRGYQDAQDARKKQAKTPSAQGKKEETLPIAPKKTSQRTYTEEQFKSALLDARVADKLAIAELTKTKNEQATKIRELEAENGRLRVENEGLKSPGNSGPTTPRLNDTGNPGNNNERAGAAAVVLLFLLIIGALAGAVWLLATHALVFLTLSVVGGVSWWVTQSWWMTATGVAVMALVCLGRCHRVKKEAEMLKKINDGKTQLQPTPGDEATTEDFAAARQNPVKGAQIQEPDAAGDALTHTAQVVPALQEVLEKGDTDAVTGGASQDRDRSACVRKRKNRERENKGRTQTKQYPQPQGGNNGKKRRQKNNRQRSGSNSRGAGPTPGAKTDRV